MTTRKDRCGSEWVTCNIGGAGLRGRGLYGVVGGVILEPRPVRLSLSCQETPNIAQSMSEEAVSDIESCAKRLTAGVLQSVLYDEQWRTFGFKHTPRRGRVWDRFVDKERLRIEYFLRREFAIVALALSCRSIKERFEYDWAVPIVARMLSILLADRSVLGALDFETLDEGLTYFEEGTKRYFAREPDTWQDVFVDRTPKLEKEKHRAGMFLGTALIMEPTQSIFPHVATTSKNICLATPLVGQVILPSEYHDQLVEVAWRLFGRPDTPS